MFHNFKSLDAKSRAFVALLFALLLLAGVLMVVLI